MNNIFFSIIIILVFNGCNHNQESIKINKELFSGNSLKSANFNFKLDYIDQFDFIQNQIDENLCNAVFPINTNFHIKDDYLETLLLYYRQCEVNEYNNEPQMHSVPAPAINILINKKGQILLEGELVSFNKLQIDLEKEIKTFNDYRYSRFIVFEIIWDNKTDIELRQEVFRNCLLAYQKYINKLSKEKYDKIISKLDKIELEDLKRNNRFALQIQYTFIKPPPPPPEH